MRTLIYIAVALVAFTVAAQPALAAKDEHAPPEGGKTKVDVADKFGLKRYDLGIYTLVVFLLLLVILGKFAWGPMMKGLDAREAGLRKQHDDAEASRAAAAQALAEVKSRLAKAHDEVRAMLDEARRDAQALKDQMKADAAADLQAERDRGRRDIETARDQALQDIYQQAVQLAAMMSTKAVKRELTAGDHARLLDEALVDLRQNLGGTKA